ncbi:serine protease [Rhizobium ruizarguesonis]
MMKAKGELFHNLDGDTEDEILESFIMAYPTISGAINFSKKLGIRTRDVSQADGLQEIWKRLFYRIKTANKLTLAVQQVIRRDRAGPRSAFLRSLLDDKPMTVAARAPRSDLFNRVEETKLFRDDLTVEVATLPAVIETLTRMKKIAQSVCRLVVKTETGVHGNGTGFRIDNARIITNYHVLFPKGQKPKTVEATFGFDSEGEAKLHRLPADLEHISGDQELDWATIVVKGMRPSWPSISVDDFELPSYDEAVYVIQHPGGRQKRIAYTRNLVKLIAPPKVGYTADTDSGSSGSPVLSARGKLVALHRTGGIEQRHVGDVPIAFNEGILAQAIRASMKEKS